MSYESDIARRYARPRKGMGFISVISLISALGVGAWPAVLALALHNAGILGKLGAETGCDSWCTALLWIVPAQVAGSYKLAQGAIELKQDFQMLSGTLSRDGNTFALEGRVRGEDVAFHAGGRQYRGKARDGKLVLN